MQKVSKIPQPGDQGVDVKVLQESLNRAGANPKLEVDGDFGEKTKAACSAFQKAIGLSGSGVPGPDTMTGLGIEVVGVENPTHGGHENSTPEATTPPTPPAPGSLTREKVASAILEIMNKDADDKLRETNGKNRSPRIDSFNKRARAYLGAPYCASGAWCALDDACKKLGIKNPAKPTASSQDFRRDSYVPKKYLLGDTVLAKTGYFGVLQVPGDTSHGHLFVVREDQAKGVRLIKTTDYNTDAISGDRDGDGCYKTVRSTVDKSKENAGKLFIGFADVPQWVVDHNS